MNRSVQETTAGVLWQGAPALPLPQRLPAPLLVEDDGVDLLVGCRPGSHDDIPDPGIHDHLGTEKAGPDLGQLLGVNLKSGKVERAAPRQFSGLEEGVHLGMDAPALLIVGSGRDVVILSPAPAELGTVHLLPGRSGIPGGYDGIVLVHDDGAEIPAETGALVGTAEGEIEEILVTVGSHHQSIGRCRK